MPSEIDSSERDVLAIMEALRETGARPVPHWVRTAGARPARHGRAPRSPRSRGPAAVL